MSPWKIIGWIVLAGLVLMLGFCALVIGRVSRNSHASNHGEAIAPTYSMEVISVNCQENYGRNKATITVKNRGTNIIPFAQVFIGFTDKSGATLSSGRSYFSPHSIPPGSLAEATVFAAEGAPNAYKCGPTAIQDANGNPVAFN